MEQKQGDEFDLGQCKEEIKGWYGEWEKQNPGPWFHTPDHFERVAKAGKVYLQNIAVHDIFVLKSLGLDQYNRQNTTSLTLDDLAKATEWWAWTSNLGLTMEGLGEGNDPAWIREGMKVEGAGERSQVIARALMGRAKSSEALIGLVQHMIALTPLKQDDQKMNVGGDPIKSFVNYMELVGEGKLNVGGEQGHARLGMVREGFGKDQVEVERWVAQTEVELLGGSKVKYEALETMFKEAAWAEGTTESPIAWMMRATEQYLQLEALLPYLKVLCKDQDKLWSLDEVLEIVKDEDGPARELLSKRWAEASDFWKDRKLQGMSDEDVEREIKRKFVERINPFRINMLFDAIGPARALFEEKPMFFDGNLEKYRAAIESSWYLPQLEMLRRKMMGSIALLNEKRGEGKRGEGAARVTIGEVKMAWGLAKLTKMVVERVDRGQSVNDAQCLEGIIEVMEVDSEWGVPRVE